MTYNLPKLFSDVQACLGRNPCVSLHELSRTLGVERHTIEKAMNHIAGISFQKYQKQRLLARALNLLIQHGELSEKQIAANLGYGSTQAFSRFIKARTGKTPSEIRRESLEKQKQYQI
jgi:AraC-like DNA-binding protein